MGTLELMTESPNPLDSVLAAVAETRGKLEATEQYWKRLRAESRALALQLIIDHGYSLNKTSLLTGHERATLKVWVESARVESGQ